jgi:hypothetical protein
MDNFRFYLGIVKKISTENLERSYALAKNYDKCYRLYRKKNFGENDWYLHVDVKKTFGGWKIRIRGSVRKWYLGKFSFKDLTKTEFENCIDLINERLGLEKDALWGAKTVYGEISLTVIAKPEMRYFLKNFVSYKEFEVMRVGNDYLKFFGDAKSLKFYNSGAKIWKERNFGRRKIERLQSLYFVIFRVEATIKDLSHVEKGTEELLATPGKILKNWNEIYAKLRMYVNDVNCYGVSSEKRFDLRNGGKKEFQRYLLRNGIEFLSPETCFADARLLKSAKVRYETKKWLQEMLLETGYASSSKEDLLLYFDRKLAKICA